MENKDFLQQLLDEYFNKVFKEKEIKTELVDEKAKELVDKILK